MIKMEYLPPNKRPDWLVIFRATFAPPELRRPACLEAQRRELVLSYTPDSHARIMAEGLQI